MARESSSASLLFNDAANRYASIFGSVRINSLRMAQPNELRQVCDLAQRVRELVEDLHHFPLAIRRNCLGNQVICLEDRLLLEKVESLV